MKKIKIRGLRFDSVTMEEAVRAVSRAMREDRRTVVYTPNAEIAQLAAEDGDVLALLNRADLLLPDGAGILLASEILKAPLKEKVAGVDFGAQILSLAAERGYPVFFLGGKPGVAELAAKKQREKHPALRVVGTHDGYFDTAGKENGDVLRQIDESRADILFVCLGAPRQEAWIDENKDRLPRVLLFAGLGGSLDIYAGTAKRAPRLFIRARLEWLYRLIREPKRLGRMMKLPRYIAGAWRERLLPSRNAEKN